MLPTSSQTPHPIRSYIRIVLLAVPLAGMVSTGCSDDDTTPAETAGSGGSGGGGGAGSGGSGGAAKPTGGTGGSSGNSGAAGMCPSSAGGPVTASAADMHCTVSGVETKQETNESSCPPPDGGIPDSDDGSDEDGGTSDFGPTMNGSEGDDDDCKYHLKWTATCVEEKTNVYFNVMITDKATGSAFTFPAADKLPVDLEVYLSPTHPAPTISTDITAKMTAPGAFTVGPIQFDAAGKWTVRFHVREMCVDLSDDSPHGHAAFFVNVP